MPRNFNAWVPRTGASMLRFALAVLALVNLVAFYFILRPVGGSPEELRQQLTDLRIQVRQRQSALERTRVLVSKVESGRTEADDFMDDYFLPRRTANSVLLNELDEAAKQSGVRPKESSFATEPVEGSDTLSTMTISSNYEGTYANLIHFINLIDKSERLLIIENLQASPQQGGNGVLNVNFKLNTFIREDGSAL